VLLALLIAPALVLAVGCASTQSAETQLDDATIGTAIKAKITVDPELNPFEIDVDVDEGMVRLSGVVESASDRAEAESLAENTDGVRGVRNDITVGDKTAGETITDAASTTKVKAQLTADAEVSGTNVDVDTSLGVVTLSGTVKSDTARAEAEKLARATDGVKRVRNLLKVRSK
jgi:osmotically-inducible protein OsmY